MTLNFVEMFSSFLFLRLYLPGLLVVVTLSFYAFLKGIFCIDRILSGGFAIWVILPIVIGLCVHVIYAAAALVCGFEYVPDREESGVPKCVIERVRKGRHTYQKSSDAVKRIFGFAHLYINCSTGLLISGGFGCFLEVGYGVISGTWLIAVVFFIAGMFNLFYGRAILADSAYELPKLGK